MNSRKHMKDHLPRTHFTIPPLYLSTTHQLPWFWTSSNLHFASSLPSCLIWAWILNLNGFIYDGLRSLIRYQTSICSQVPSTPHAQSPGSLRCPGSCGFPATVHSPWRRTSGENGNGLLESSIEQYPTPARTGDAKCRGMGNHFHSSWQDRIQSRWKLGKQVGGKSFSHGTWCLVPSII